MNPLCQPKDLEVSKGRSYLMGKIETLRGRDANGREFSLLKVAEHQDVPNIKPLEKPSFFNRHPPMEYWLEECNLQTVESGTKLKSLLERNLILILAGDGNLFSLFGFEDYGKIQRGSKFKSFSQKYLGRKPGKPQKFGDVLHEHNHLVFKSFTVLDPQSSKTLRKVFSEIAWWFDDAPGKAMKQYTLVHKSPSLAPQATEKYLTPLERPFTAKNTSAHFLSDTHRFPKNPPIPFDQTDFKTLEDFFGNNCDKDSTGNVLMLLRQAIHLAKRQGYLEFDFKHSFDRGEKLEAIPYTNTTTNNPGLKIKVSFYITAWKDKSKKEEINLVLERNLYLQCTTVESEAFKGAATFCNNKLEAIDFTTIFIV